MSIVTDKTIIRKGKKFSSKLENRYLLTTIKSASKINAFLF